jgi:hypothetical protein
MCFDYEGIDRVEFTDNGKVQHIDDSYDYEWNFVVDSLTELSGHMICAVAYDYDGNDGTDCIYFNKTKVVDCIAVSIAPSINANIDRLPIKSKLVETSVRIHRSNGITPFTLKLSEKESDEIDRIFDNLKVRLDSAETGEEIDEIYDDAVESLYELGLFPRMTLREAKQLVKGKSKSQSSNVGSGDENFNCSISGQTTHTYSFGLKNLLNLDRFFLNFILGFLRLYDVADNYRYYLGKINSICFGEYWSGYPYWYPSNGWVHTNGTNGVVKWEGKFYGGAKGTEWLGGFVYEYQTWTFIGVKKFEGLFIDLWSQQPPCYLGNAEYVKIRYDQPPPPYI